MFVSVLQTVCSVLAAVLGVLYFYQMVYLFVPVVLRKKKPTGPIKQHRFAILIAARNEENVIPHLLDSINAQDYPAELLTTYVIADNCTDNTAEAARKHGAHVYVRFNKEKVGKGYALDYLLDQLKADGLFDQHDAFMIFDADNLLLPNYFTEMNKTVAQGYEAFSGYRNTKNFGSNWLSAGYSVWYLHDSVHMNQSRYLLGQPCAVNGTGFGLTRELLERIGGWKFFTLTEDIEFSLVCATRGYKVGYCHDAILYDEQPTKWRQSWKQRTRWSQGGIQIAFRYTGDLFRGLFKGGRTTLATIEQWTLSLWGVTLGTVSAILALILAFLMGGINSVVTSLVVATATTYGTMAMIGLWTVLTEWKRIHTSGWRKIFSALCFPLYIITWLPISATAGFKKFQWTPIEHTVAVSTQEVTSGGKK